MARPFKEVDAALVLELASIHCTVEEIARVCKCSKDTLERRFMDEIEDGRANGRESLRRLQWTSARGGNVTMQIWLGKQLLGQRDFKLELSAYTDEMLAGEIQRRMKASAAIGA
jgi:hypothetical protein